MATKKTKQNKRPRQKFIEVNVWRNQFGPTSVRAIYDVFSTKFKIETHNMRNYSFSDCVNALRRSEDPTYKFPKDVSSY